MEAREEDLKQVISDVLGISAESIGEDTSIDTVEEWDSLKHLNLVLAIEEAYDLSLTEEQTVEILSYPLIVAVLGEHGVVLTK